jgi:hypothetical protein
MLRLHTNYGFQELFLKSVIIYKFTQENLDAKRIANSRFQSPVKKKNRKLRHWRPTARFLFTHNFFFNHVYFIKTFSLLQSGTIVLGDYCIEIQLPYNDSYDS